MNSVDVKKTVPVHEFYISVLTRPIIARLYDKYYNTGLGQQDNIQTDKIIRALIIECLRYINMSVQDVSVLLVCGLTKLTRAVLDMPVTQLIDLLIRENTDTSDSNVINRIVAQINTKLPADLRVLFTPLLRVKIMNVLNTNFLGKIGINTGVTELFVNTDEKADAKYRTELHDVVDALGYDTVKDLYKAGYNIKDLTKTNVMRLDPKLYDDKLNDLVPSNNNIVTKETPTDNIINAKYVDYDPQLQMDIKTKDLYYYDENSGSLINITDVENIDASKLTTEKQLNNIFKKYELSNAEITKLLQTVSPSPNETPNVPVPEQFVNFNMSSWNSNDLYMYIIPICVLCAILYFGWRIYHK